MPGMADSSDEASIRNLQPAASSLKPGSEARFGADTPSTLNSAPMPVRPPAVSRFNAAEISSDTSGAAFAIKRHGAGLDAEPFQELALRHRSVNKRADVFRGAAPAPGSRHAP